MLDRSDPHYETITKCITDGNLVPFLGAGANLCGRPQNVPWQGKYLPSGGELAALLAGSHAYPKRELTLHCPNPNCNSELRVSCPKCHTEVRALEETQDLLRIAQYVANCNGLGQLYDDLHKVFAAQYAPTALHRFLATLPQNLETLGCPQPGLLVVTTNYDDLMEQAFEKAGQPVDIVSYVAQGEHQGRFLHWPPSGDPRLIDEPNAYPGLLEERPVVLKIHGAISRVNKKDDSYVIREDDYIDYLARTTDLANVLPSVLLAKLKESHLLFLGYSLSDWNLRVILYRIWSKQALDYTSWAIQFNAQQVDQKLWSKRNVEILDVNLEDYVNELQTRIAGMGKNVTISSVS